MDLGFNSFFYKVSGNNSCKDQARNSRPYYAYFHFKINRQWNKLFILKFFLILTSTFNMNKMSDRNHISVIPPQTPNL